MLTARRSEQIHFFGRRQESVCCQRKRLTYGFIRQAVSIFIADWVVGLVLEQELFRVQNRQPTSSKCLATVCLGGNVFFEASSSSAEGVLAARQYSDVMISSSGLFSFSMIAMRPVVARSFV